MKGKDIMKSKNKSGSSKVAERFIRAAEGNLFRARKNINTAIKQLRRAAIILDRTGNRTKAAELRVAIRILVTADDLILKGISFN